MGIRAWCPVYSKIEVSMTDNSANKPFGVRAARYAGLAVGTIALGAAGAFGRALRVFGNEEKVCVARIENGELGGVEQGPSHLPHAFVF